MGGASVAAAFTHPHPTPRTPAYLAGIPPKGYDLSALGAYTQRRELNVQAGTRLCDAEFRAAVAAGAITSTTLHDAACVALGGVAAEYVTRGSAEGGLADVAALDALLGALRFTQAKAADTVRWALLDAVALLRRHAAAHAALAAAMAANRSVAACVAVVEETLSADV